MKKIALFLISIFSLALTCSAQKYIKTIKFSGLNSKENIGIWGYIKKNNEFYTISYNLNIAIYDANTGKLKQKINFGKINPKYHVQQIMQILYNNAHYYVFAYFENTIYITNKNFQVSKKIKMDNYHNGSVAMRIEVWSKSVFLDDENLLIPTNIYYDNIYLFKKLNLKNNKVYRIFKHPYIPTNSNVDPSLRFSINFAHPQYGRIVVFPFSNILWDYDKTRAIGQLKSSVDTALKLVELKDLNDNEERAKYFASNTMIVQVGFSKKESKVFRFTIFPASSIKEKSYMKRNFVLSVYSTDFKLLYEKELSGSKYFPYAFSNKNGFYLMQNINNDNSIKFDIFIL